ncbi:hypothetical protein DFP72DRAFT_1076069 [Ephemerocybe angulata]|uniref:Prolyl 4-hydroxylase alpha subunit domain-containing protein n=1 Tax=Ephemerocybe angulata TaxID=980116 RepID=A0A8H6LYH8_9AGAR|nr:hypothetical protein DFP72DRAFT_1076069 [Tulosesus angulatus]
MIPLSPLTEPEVSPPPGDDVEFPPHFIRTEWDSSCSFDDANEAQEIYLDHALGDGERGSGPSEVVDGAVVEKQWAGPSHLPSGQPVLQPSRCSLFSSSIDELVVPSIAGDQNPSTTPAVRPASVKGRARRRAEDRQAQAIERKKLAGPASALRYRPKASTFKYHSKFDRISSALDASNMPHASGGAWIGKRSASLRDKPWTVDELLNEMDFTLVPYEDGKNVVFLDSKDRIVGGRIAKSQKEDWNEVIDEGAKCLREVRKYGFEEGILTEDDVDSRRGPLLALPVGVSTGGGQTKPSNLYQNLRTRRLLTNSILRNKAIKRIAGAQSSAFAFLNPKLYKKYTEDLGALFASDSSLKANFDNSIFPAASFNCSDQSVSLDHFDFGNLSYGFCALTALGNFDFKRGGHLILFELKLVVEFPPGSTCVIPSAAIRHGNTPILPGEERMSIAQYAAGGLFRWVAYGFKTGKMLATTAAGRRARAAADGASGILWFEGLDLYSTRESLFEDHKAMRGMGA